MQTLKTTFARLCRETRIMLDVTQQEVALACRVSRAHIAAIESGRANPSLDLVQRISDILRLSLDFAIVAPLVIGPRQRDLVHAWCSAYVERRLRSAGWLVRREVEVVLGRSHGWIDLLAFDPRSNTLLVIEIKTILDDLGAVERQIAWYERQARSVSAGIGWDPVRVVSWVLALASAEVDEVARMNRDVMRTAFPVRAQAMRDALSDSWPDAHGRGFALIDPASRRRDWLIACRIDGRRSAAPYRDYADAARRRRSA